MGSAKGQAEEEVMRLAALRAHATEEAGEVDVTGILEEREEDDRRGAVKPTEKLESQARRAFLLVAPYRRRRR